MRHIKYFIIGLVLLVVVITTSWVYFPQVIKQITNRGTTHITLFVEDTVTAERVKGVIATASNQNDSNLSVKRTSNVVTVSMPLLEVTRYSEVEMALQSSFGDRVQLRGMESLSPTDFTFWAYFIPIGLLTAFGFAILLVAKGMKRDGFRNQKQFL